MQPLQEGMIRWVSSIAPITASATGAGAAAGVEGEAGAKVMAVTGTTVLRLGVPDGLKGVLEFAR
jgi:hypothetical protein